jgi:TolB-like protein
VATEKLVHRLFPKSNFGDEELASKVLELRGVLDDNSKENPLLRWLPGIGYRFEARVNEFLGDSESEHLGGVRQREKGQEEEPEQTAAPEKLGQMKLGRMLGIAAAVVLVTTLSVWGWRFMNTGGSSKSVEGTREVAGLAGNSKIAVLPIGSLSGSADDERFDRALTVGIIDALARDSQAQVVPAGSVAGYTKFTAKDQLAAGRELGVGMIVLGMAQALAGRVRVRVQMVGTEDGIQLWTGDFDGDTKDTVGLAAQVSQKILKQMRASEGEKPTP